MGFKEKTEAYHKLAYWLKNQIDDVSRGKVKVKADSDLRQLLAKQYNANSWLTEDFSVVGINSAISNLLSFTENWSFINSLQNNSAKKVGLILSLNIPLSGLNECLLILLSEHELWIRNDLSRNILLKAVFAKLCEFEPNFSSRINFTNTFPKNIDGWIVFNDSRNENSSLIRYLPENKSLFIPKLIGAVYLDGNESVDNLDDVANNVFTYWGFHPDNIRKLIVPEGYSFDKLFQAMEKYSFVYDHNRYANNYDYHKSIFLMDSKPFLDNGFLVLYETVSDYIPIGCLGFQYYSPQNASLNNLNKAVQRDKIFIKQLDEVMGLLPGDGSETYFRRIIEPQIIDFLVKI